MLLFKNRAWEILCEVPAFLWEPIAWFRVCVTSSSPYISVGWTRDGRLGNRSLPQQYRAEAELVFSSGLATRMERLGPQRLWNEASVNCAQWTGERRVGRCTEWKAVNPDELPMTFHILANHGRIIFWNSDLCFCSSLLPLWSDSWIIAVPCTLHVTG